MTKRLPLQGLRVLDFTWVIAGPLVTRLLAALGAQVIKIETATRIDLMRTAGPYRGGVMNVNAAGYFNNFNTDKLSATVNLARPEGRELVLRLAAVSDVIAENFVPGVLERYGLGYQDFRAARPDVVMLRMPGIGLDGPHARSRQMGSHIQAAAGLDEITGPPGGQPIGTGMSYPDASSSPFHAVAALLVALAHRRATGQGQLLELSQYEAAVCFNGVAVLDWSANRRIESRLGNRSPFLAPHGIYRCLGYPGVSGSDRWCAIAARTQGEWRALVRAMGSPAWARDRRFSTALGRLRHAGELDARIEAWTRGQAAEAVMERLQAAGVPAGIVQTAGDMLTRDPQLRHRGFFAATDHPEAGRIHHDGHPFRFSTIEHAPRRPPPCLGQHTDLVLQEILGLGEAQVNGLVLSQALS